MWGPSPRQTGRETPRRGGGVQRERKPSQEGGGGVGGVAAEDGERQEARVHLGKLRLDAGGPAALAGGARAELQHFFRGGPALGAAATEGGARRLARRQGGVSSETSLPASGQHIRRPRRALQCARPAPDFGSDQPQLRPASHNCGLLAATPPDSTGPLGCPLDGRKGPERLQVPPRPPDRCPPFRDGETESPKQAGTWFHNPAQNLHAQRRPGRACLWATATPPL